MPFPKDALAHLQPPPAYFSVSISEKLLVGPLFGVVEYFLTKHWFVLSRRQDVSASCYGDERYFSASYGVGERFLVEVYFFIAFQLQFI